METTLGKRITANRKRLGFTQDQLAEKLGITAQAISKWENDLSCPDITMLPKLADIFGISIDELLGREQTAAVCQTEWITEESSQDNGFTYDSDSGKMNFHWNGGKKDGLSLACWVILTGIVYLIAQLTHVDISFWNALWPTFLLAFGLFGLYPKFSAFRLGCALVGGYFLMSKLQILSVKLDNGILIAIAVILFGLSLLADVLRKRKASEDLADNRKVCNDYAVDSSSFTYDASFGSDIRLVQMETLRSGSISTNFGEYTVDLSGVAALESPCRLSADCSFGELTILVPRHFTVIPDSSTAFADFKVTGSPDSISQGTIHLSASVSFGEICVSYL